MNSSADPSDHHFSLDRRELLAYAAAFGPALLAGSSSAAQPARPPASPRRMKKSINLWAFPYPHTMTLTECLTLAKEAGFDGVELNYDLESDVSVNATAQELQAIAQTAADLGIAISGLCSFLFWPYSLTSNDPERRKKGRDLARRMVDAAAELGTQNLLVVPGAVYIPWAPEPDPVPNNVCHERAVEAIAELLPHAQAAGVSLNMENIFANGFLLTPQEMNDFVDSFDSDAIGVHFDTGNIMQFQFPEHWIRQCGSRIRNVHLKEYSKQAGTEFTLESFRPLLDGTTNWPAVLDAFEEVGYEGYLTFEYFHPYPHWPEALIHQTSDSLDRMLGRK